MARHIIDMVGNVRLTFPGPVQVGIHEGLSLTSSVVSKLLQYYRDPTVKLGLHEKSVWPSTGREPSLRFEALRFLLW
jgi:hypothetical protein